MLERVSLNLVYPSGHPEVWLYVLVDYCALVPDPSTAARERAI